MAATHPEALLVPYLSGELSAGERERIGRHLEGCARCREFADSTAAVLRNVAREVAEVPEPDWALYRAGLHRKLAARAEARPRWWRAGLAWGSLATAGVAVAALLVFLLHPGPRLAAPGVGELAMEDAMAGADVGLLRDYRVVESLDLLENYDVIEHLDELAPALRPNAESRS